MVFGPSSACCPLAPFSSGLGRSAKRLSQLGSGACKVKGMGSAQGLIPSFLLVLESPRNGDRDGGGAVVWVAAWIWDLGASPAPREIPLPPQRKEQQQGLADSGRHRR